MVLSLDREEYRFYIPLLVCCTIASFIITWLVRYFALRKSIIDIPNERSSHSIPTPRGGGVAVVISWFASLIYLYVANHIEKQLFYAFLCAIPLAIVGFIDDIFSIKPWIRFIVQALSALLGIIFLGGKISLDLGFYTIESVYILTPIAWLLVIWYINLFNFLDGIDGYIGMEVVFLGLVSGILFPNNVGIVLAAITLGFLFWNWQRAKIFMGDVGSTFLGFNIAIMALYQQNQGVASALQWIILTSVFWFDATITLYRRWKNGEKLSTAHRKHAYQRIVQYGFSHQKTVLYALLLNFVGMGFVVLGQLKHTYILVFLLLDLSLLYLVIKYIDRKFPFEKLKPRTRN